MAEKLTEELLPVPAPRPTQRPHPDDEYVDEIRIHVQERWKESEVSGDEWRFSGVVRFFRKGRQLWCRATSNMAVAVAAVPWWWHTANETDEWKRLPDAVDESLCCQPGCWETWYVEYQQKKLFHHRGDAVHPDAYLYTRPQRRRYCYAHKGRGDCGLDDSDSNYELVGTNPAWTPSDVDWSSRCGVRDPRTGMRCLSEREAHRRTRAAGEPVLHGAAVFWTDDE